MIQPHAVSSIPKDFINEIQFEIDLCPVDAIELQLRRSIIDFCEKTHYWKESAVPIDVVVDNVSYPVLTGSGLEVVGVVYVANEDGEIELVRSSDPSVAYRYWQSSPGHIQLYPNDRLVGLTLRVDVAVRPVESEGEFEVSTSLLSDYRGAIIAGAKSALYKVPRKSWTDLQQANIESSIFESIVSDARRFAMRGYSLMPDQRVQKNRLFY